MQKHISNYYEVSYSIPPEFVGDARWRKSFVLSLLARRCAGAGKAFWRRTGKGRVVDLIGDILWWSSVGKICGDSLGRGTAGVPEMGRDAGS